MSFVVDSSLPLSEGTIGKELPHFVLSEVCTILEIPDLESITSYRFLKFDRLPSCMSSCIFRHYVTIGLTLQRTQSRDELIT